MHHADQRTLTGPACVQLDRRWKCIRTGQPYYGEAIAPSNLSYFERFTRVGKVCALLPNAPSSMHLSSMITQTVFYVAGMTGLPDITAHLPTVVYVLHLAPACTTESSLACTLELQTEGLRVMQNYDRARDEEARWAEGAGNKGDKDVQMGGPKDNGVVV